VDARFFAMNDSIHLKSRIASLERLRRKYRPRRIRTLFVGESAPHGGTFFYSQNSGLFREMRKAFHGKEDFLDTFKKSGFYLDDLVLEPVNHLERGDRQFYCREAIPSLAKRLKDYRPEAVVILLHAIRPMVMEAIREASLSCEVYCTPYPGFGNQPRFHREMSHIIPRLPRLKSARNTPFGS
jgi:hypothetical protein